MKVLGFLFVLFPAIVLGQYKVEPPTAMNHDVTLFKATYDSSLAAFVAKTKIAGRTFATGGVGVTDTSNIMFLSKHSAFFVTVMSRDSGVCLIKYQTSLDGSTWGALTTIDSCVTTTDVNTVKSVSLASTLLGVRWVRFVFAWTKNQTAFGTTTPTYDAAFKWVQF